MILNRQERLSLSDEIAILVMDTYAVGIFENGDRACFRPVRQSALKDTIYEAISRTIDSRLVLPDKP